MGKLADWHNRMVGNEQGSRLDMAKVGKAMTNEAKQQRECKHLGNATKALTWAKQGRTLASVAWKTRAFMLL